MITTWASPEGVHCAGSIDDVPEKLAVELVTGGFAKYAGPVENKKTTPADETTSMRPAENTTVRTALKKKPKSK